MMFPTLSAAKNKHDSNLNAIFRKSCIFVHMEKMSYYNRLIKNLMISRDANSTSLPLDYVCPLCMRSFNLEVAKVELTEEDVPQNSLGGHPITLTCKQCNNKCGSNIDVHLLETIKGIEQRAYLPGTDRKVTIQNGDERLFATLKVGENKNMLLNINTKHNNPKTWELFHDKILFKDSVINLLDAPLKQDIRRFSAAVLKNAYLILFEKTGYTFLSDIYYDRLRQQIKTPDSYILPERLWTFQDVSVPDGIYLTRDNRYRGFFVVYSLKRIHSYRVCVLIPTPKVEYLVACMELSKIHSKSSIRVMPLPHEDFICDEISVRKLYNWAYGWNIDL